MKDVSSIKKEYQKLLQELTDSELLSDLERFEDLSRQKKSLEKILDKQKEIEETKRQIEENKGILKSGEDAELSSLAEVEIANLHEKEKNLEKDLESLLKTESDTFSDIIIEIRAGTGGQEASLFAGNLYRMYSKYAESQGWAYKVLDSSQSDLGGFKEIIFEIKGQGAYSRIKNEGGVHRVQRIPETEKTGRVHTSTATVAVMPKPKLKDINIRTDELKIDVFRSSGPGGQNVQKRETAVRITHIPTGIVVASQTERNQLQNKENAMTILLAKILERRDQEEQSKMAGKRKSQIGGAKRSEKIRTYNFPQDRVTDHRIKKNFHNINEIMEGSMDKVIEALLEIKEEQIF